MPQPGHDPIDTLDVQRIASYHCAMSDQARLRTKYRDRRTARFAAGIRVKEFQAFERQAYKRLEILEAAETKEALIELRSNRFEALHGDRAGQFSIRINNQWRICFEWPDWTTEALQIEIVDYH
jgi:proteic killer suppression protein